MPNGLSLTSILCVMSPSSPWKCAHLLLFPGILPTFNQIYVLSSRHEGFDKLAAVLHELLELLQRLTNCLTKWLVQIRNGI